jgi:1-acyl-sn-glycerol-3-phosphate acyltransferase
MAGLFNKTGTHARGVLTLIFYILFTAFFFVIIQIFLVIKLLLPFSRARGFAARAIDGLASTGWIFCSNLTHRLFTNTRFIIHSPEERRVRRWCLLLSNHQTWVDILVIIRVFFRKVPPYKFFVKKELLWLPLMGCAFWALDFPIMKRYSREFLEKHPHLKGKDLEQTRRACEKFKTRPVTIMNFVEGTRYTPAKHQAQKSPYKHLLRPRAGGTALVLYAMGEMLEEIVDITIVYPEGAPGLWDFFGGRSREVIVDIRRMPVTRDLIGDYYGDPEFRSRFQDWLNGLWARKDEQMDRYLSG